ncbi:MAG: MFS transporter [Actinobacteria bacterium]|nr:MFS transporter [Actinomycetota bacterium]
MPLVRALSTRFGRTYGSLAATFRNPNLRRIQLAWMGSVVGNWSYSVALAVYAYQQGGPAAVGLVAVIRLLPSALAAPIVAVAADRFPRERVMIAADLIRAPLMAVAALTILSGGPAPVVYAAAGLASVVGTAFRPAQAALLPSLARDPEELSAANVASSTVESVGSFLGPALGGLLLAVTSAEVVFGVNGLSFLWSALLVARIRAETPPPAPLRSTRPRFTQELAAGFRALAADRGLRLVVGLYAAQTLVAGAFAVLVVVTALELLELGEAGVGFLNSAVGIGGLLGALLALTLAVRGRLALDFGLGVALYGAPLALVAIWTEPAFVLALLVVSGIGNTLTDISALTLMQRAVPDEVLARVFGVLESILLASIGAGALLAPLLVATIGTRGALIATGLFLPVLVLLSSRGLAVVSVGARVEPSHVALLAQHPIFAPLPPATLEQLAGRLVAQTAAAGEVIVRVGEEGTRFYLIEAGTVAADAGRVPVELEAGDGFGEIALLRDVPRTATVTARTPVRLLALERDDFLGAVTQDAHSAGAADALVAGRLGPIGPGVSRG